MNVISINITEVNYNNIKLEMHMKSTFMKYDILSIRFTGGGTRWGGDGVYIHVKMIGKNVTISLL